MIVSLQFVFIYAHVWYIVLGVLINMDSENYNFWFKWIIIFIHNVFPCMAFLKQFEWMSNMMCFHVRHSWNNEWLVLFEEVFNYYFITHNQILKCSYYAFKNHWNSFNHQVATLYVNHTCLIIYQTHLDLFKMIIYFVFMLTLKIKYCVNGIKSFQMWVGDC